ncbi:MAG: 4Fe-4S dicluster domain-containing protein [Phycisphaeraceae bacterium]|nr:MAG: 4Fe-4S dicluster domain-containing protein [Phycisphaeraceae bacterium]
MSRAKQCPSTVGKKPAETPSVSAGRSAATGKEFWRGLDELAETPEFREMLHREFPAGASELLEGSRREFLRVMAASLALAGVAAVPGCRRPDHKIMPYTRDPEDVIHGESIYYATAMPLPGGGAEGVLVESHTGRPTKVEGNPLHSINQGKSSVWAQASILDLYDPDRLMGPSRLANGERRRATWREFEEFASRHFARFNNSRGRGLVFLVEKSTSPSRDAMRRKLMQRWPEARWLPYEAADNENALTGARIAFGEPRREILNLANARVIVSVDRDFVSGHGEDSMLSDARGFAAGRRVLETSGDESRMSRLYAVESAMTPTGGMADHRLRLRPSQIGLYVGALAAAVAQRVGNAGELGGLAARFSGAPARLGIGQEWIDAVADDLIENRGASVVVVGAAQPAPVHALAHAINAAIGAVGSTVSYAAMPEDAAASSSESIRTLARMSANELDTLVVIGANPVYSAPADLNFADRFASISTTIHLGLHQDETAEASTWRLNRAHFMETWGDVVAADGSMSVVQPMIAPIGYEPDDIEPGRGELELLALLLGEERSDPFEIVRDTWREMLNSSENEFRKRWRRTLHDGFLQGTAGTAISNAGRINFGALRSAVDEIESHADAEGIEVVFRPCYKLGDGRFANNGWLNELPNPVTKVCWDNPALISPATAMRLGVVDGDEITIEVGGRSLDIPVWRMPGLSDETIVLDLGYGRTAAGRVGLGVGFNTYSLRASDVKRLATGASATKGRRRHEIACVQTHWAMEGRPIILESDHQAWLAHGDEVLEDHKDAYGQYKPLRFADRLPPNNAPHTPANESIYQPRQQHTYESRPQWGMSIDLGNCSGCGVCTIACQAENNIPIVGKNEVIKGREMHWIRVDRYFATPVDQEQPRSLSDFGDAGPYTGGRRLEDPDMAVMPVPCMHCENAPCETVCPVNATVHGREGLNEMTYNRCIGTRYCSNNCPYKVRRFNYFDYATKRLGGDYVGKDLVGGAIRNEHLVPPRLREKIEEGKGELQVMQYNPHVTVRERGVMEKCTYCVQRINEARTESKLKGLDAIPDGFFQTACQQACPTEAIVFGDILDPLSKIRRMRDNGRTYDLLGYLNIRPRTTYLARLRNPNSRLRDPVVDPFDEFDPARHKHSEASQDEGRIMSLPVLTNAPSPIEAMTSVAAKLGGTA